MKVKAGVQAGLQAVSRSLSLFLSPPPPPFSLSQDCYPRVTSQAGFHWDSETGWLTGPREKRSCRGFCLECAEAGGTHPGLHGLPGSLGGCLHSSGGSRDVFFLRFPKISVSLIPFGDTIDLGYDCMIAF